MALSTQKVQRLVEIARLYYEQDLSQNEIAQRLNISRPLVSRLLSEARAEGIVSIEIHAPGHKADSLWTELRLRYGIRGGIYVPSLANDNLTNRRLAEQMVELLLTQKARHIGVGWGTLIGELVSVLDERPAIAAGIHSICPLVGNSGVSTRNYHSDENTRIIARQLGAEPQYLYAPAFAETRDEMLLMEQLPYYQAVSAEWENLDLALVNIGNFPSVPDFACASRYGSMLTQGKAKGRLLAYYFDRDGRFFYSDTDYAIQIPLDTLRRCRNIVGVCSASTTPEALRGALASKLLHQIVAPEELLMTAVGGVSP